MKVALFGIFMGVSIQVLADLNKIGSGFPRPTFIAFGNPIFGLYVQHFWHDVHPRIQDLLGVMMLGCTIWVIGYLSKKGFLVFPETRILTKPENRKDAFFSTFSITFLLVYFASSSYDYRLVYLVIAALIYISRIQIHRRSFVILGLLLVAATWSSVHSKFMPIGDLAILGFSAVFVRGLYFEIKSGSFKAVL